MIDHIPPVSSLETILRAVNDALDQEVVNVGGILDLESYLDETNDNIAILDMASMFPQIITNSSQGQAQAENEYIYPTEDIYRWVHEAKIILSPYGRPTGWRLKFANRSIASALLRSTGKQNPLMCGWKIVTANEWTPAKEKRMEQKFNIETSMDQTQSTTPPRVRVVEPIGKHHLNYDAIDGNHLHWLDDSVLRIENCNEEVDEQNLLHIFSRYELRSPSIVKWTGKTVDGKRAPLTFLVRFMDASWARAALREKQATVIHGAAIRLVQYPRQLLQA